jgi:VWFA-related protein
MRSVPIWRFTLVLGSVLLAAEPSAQQREKAPLERGIDFLRVDFGVVTSDGQPVTDLVVQDVAVRIAGRQRAIRSLQLIQAADPRASADAEATRVSLPAPFGSNTDTETGRTVVLAIDDDSFRPGREAPLRDAVDLLLKRLSPQDRIALVTMPYGGLKVPFTNDPTKVRTAMSRISGRAPADETGSAFACRTARTLEALISFFGTLGVREEPATMMFITAGLAPPRRDAPMTMAPGMCELRSDLFSQVGVAAGAARAQFYIVQPGDLMRSAGGVQRENIAGVGSLGSDNPIEGIEHLAGVTGGKMLNLTGSAETAFGRILRESSAHYVAAVDPQPTDRSGRSQQLEIRVKRSGVDVRARPHITFAKPEPSLGRAVGLSPREMLSTTAVFRDLPLRATAYTALEPDGKTMRVITLAEAVEPDVKFGAIVAALFDEDGKPVSHWSATAEEMARKPVVGAMPAPPASYRLRVAAVDSNGRSGTADYDVAAESSTSGPLTLSSIVLGLSREGSFAPRLQFTNEPVAIGYLEMFGAAAGVPVSASLEIASTLNGPAIVRVPLAIESSGQNRYVAKGALPIGGLPAGDYIVRALVGLEGHPMTRVTRTLRKALVGPVPQTSKERESL